MKGKPIKTKTCALHCESAILPTAVHTNPTNSPIPSLAIPKRIWCIYVQFFWIWIINKRKKTKKLQKKKEGKGKKKETETEFCKKSRFGWRFELLEHICDSIRRFQSYPFTLIQLVTNFQPSPAPPPSSHVMATQARFLLPYPLTAISIIPPQSNQQTRHNWPSSSSNSPPTGRGTC